MFINPGGRERTEASSATCCAGQGYELARVISMPSPQAVMEVEVEEFPRRPQEIRYTTSAARSPAARAHAASMSSSNSSVSFFIIVPPSSSASTMVTARR